MLQITDPQLYSVCGKTNITWNWIKQHLCMCIWVSMCVHAYVSVHVFTYVYICMAADQMAGGVTLGEWWGSSIFMDQSQGQGSCSGPCSRWMEASDGSSLAGCSIPAGLNRPTATNPPHHLSCAFFSVHRDLSWKCLSTGILLGLA